MGLVFTIGNVGVKVGVGTFGAGVLVGACFVSEICTSIIELSAVGAVPPPIDATAGGVSVGKFSPPGAWNTGAEADFGDREHAILTPARINPSTTNFCSKRTCISLALDFINRIATFPGFYRLAILG